jgi:hypothetical protein
VQRVESPVPTEAAPGWLLAFDDSLGAIGDERLAPDRCAIQYIAQGRDRARALTIKGRPTQLHGLSVWRAVGVLGIVTGRAGHAP